LNIEHSGLDADDGEPDQKQDKQSASQEKSRDPDNMSMQEILKESSDAAKTTAMKQVKKEDTGDYTIEHNGLDFGISEEAEPAKPAV